SLGGSNELLEGPCNPGRSFGDLDNFGERDIRWNARRTEWMKQHRDRVIAASNPSNSQALQFIRSGVQNIAASIETVRAATAAPLNYNFPNTGLGNACADAVRLIRARELGVQFIFLRIGGFDTHSG